MTDKRSVAVLILGKQYRIRTDAEQAAVERVARFVDETMTRIRQRTGTVDSLDLAVLAALNLANDLLALRESAGDGEAAPKRLRDLVDRVEAAVGRAATSPAA